MHMKLIYKVEDCDFCTEAGVTTPAEYDVPTRLGPWANLCRPHKDRWGLDVSYGYRLTRHAEDPRLQRVTA